MKNDRFTAAVPTIERAIGYTFRDKGLLRQAFTRSSWCNEHPQGGYQSNEVLEFFGDSVLSVAIITFLLAASTKRGEHGIRTELCEGDFSNIKSKLSDKTNLSVSMAKLGLEEHLLLGEGDAKLGIAKEPSVMEDLFESIVGAVYIDSDKNLDTVTKVVARMLDMSVYSDSSAASVSPKNALQEWCADKKRRLPPPVYKTVSEHGPDHKKEYERGVYIGERLLATACGKNQKTADSLAAKEALKLLMSEAAEVSGQTAPAPKAKTGESSKSNDGQERSGSNDDKSRAKKKTEGTPGKACRESAKVKSGSDIQPNGGSAASKQAAKPDRTEKTPKPKTKPTLSASALLRTHAVKMSVAGPVFRDLGLIDKDEHGVECSFMGQRAIATAPTRPEAKERAAESIRDALGLKQSSK